MPSVRRSIALATASVKRHRYAILIAFAPIGGAALITNDGDNFFEQMAAGIFDATIVSFYLDFDDLAGF